MDSNAILERLKQQRFYRDQIVDARELEAREPCYQNVAAGLPEPVAVTLGRQGIDRLYSHQAAAIDVVHAGRSVVVVTGTASGKTLCYTIPVVEAMLADSNATALFIYPTKALAQDQLRALAKWRQADLGIDFMAGTYDGDTPQNLRRKLRDAGHVILTNPDMLHQGILPNHARWNRFFSHLKYIVIDEVHAYRGVFGSHLSNVIRRVQRICQHYGSSPQFVCSSATIANPAEHASAITGQAMELVDEDGSPRGRKLFVLWNPPPLVSAASGDPSNWRAGGDRRSARREAVKLMSMLVEEGIQTITFVRTRLAAELIYKECRDRLRRVSRKLAGSVQAYRGGYLAEERREIERRLADGEIMGVASTNALELGIDIGSLDACILVGYPGTIASTWQQAGRAGRSTDDSIVFLMAQNAPIDQYLMMHAAYLFEQTPEQAVVDQDNPHVVIGHLKCAAAELPLSAADADMMGPYAGTILELLAEDGAVRHIDDHWYWASSEFPAAGVNLRNIAGPVYTIQDEAEGERVIGTMDEVTALAQLHTHAVYLHGADTYFVNRLDIEQKIAFVERKDLDYYTQSVQSSQIRIDEPESDDELLTGVLGYGDVTVTTTIPMFKKIRFDSRDSLGFEKLDLPPQSLETVAMWFGAPDGATEVLLEKGLILGEAMIGVANVVVEVAPLFVMCDQQDIGVVVDSSNLRRETLFLHDRYPGGMGYARRCMDAFEDILRAAHDVINECGCHDGCPSCVGSAVPASAMTDLDSAVRGRIPDKAAALALLELLFGS